MKHIVLGLPVTLAATFVLTAAAPKEASAQDSYCREYTRSVYIGGQREEAYGTACMQPDGSWMIVGEGLGGDIPENVTKVNYIIHDDRRDFVPARVVYVEPKYKYYKYKKPPPSFVWYNNGRYVNYHPKYINYGRGHHYNGGYNYGWNDRDDDHTNIDIRYRSGW
jgi:hypothetical protein